MSFTGKATYSGGVELPEIAEDVSDLVSIVSPHETPLLDALGEAMRVSRSTVHEWLEDELLPNFDTIVGEVGNANTAVTIGVANVNRFRVGDQVRQADETEAMLVTEVDAINGTISVIRGYGGSSRGDLVAGRQLHILGNAALEGDSADAARFTIRSRRQNCTQIFSATVEVSGSELASRQLGLTDEMNYQKQLRVRELLRDLENSVINGRSSDAVPSGMAARRTMNGLLAMIQTNVLTPGQNGLPAGVLTEETLSAALRHIWMSSGSPVDLVVVGAAQKRRINQFTASNRRFAPADDRYRDMINVIETDFGVCRVVLSRYVPANSVLLLDSSRIEVMPLSGRSFFYKPLASTGDREAGQIVGEYTLELRNENAHGVITGLEA